MDVNRSRYFGSMGTCGTGILGVDAAMLVLVVEYECRVAGIEDAEMIGKKLERWRENSDRIVLWLEDSFMGLRMQAGDCQCYRPA